MFAERPWLQRLHFVASFTAIYGLTLAFGWYVVQHHAHSVNLANTTTLARNIERAQEALVPTVSGKPVRIVLPDSGVDLPIDDGIFDGTNQEWTLSGYRAQFAVVSRPANNKAGQTFIYGHNNNYVFGALRHATPEVGAPALIYTDNGHIFAYKFQSVRSVAATDSIILHKDGRPEMIIQTCTGALNEIRTLYSYSFDRVVQ